jgi:thiol-disulfide isomerase/thioredoxin
MSKLLFIFIFPMLTFSSTAYAFTPQMRVLSSSKSFARTTLAAVTDIGSEAAFDKTIKNAGSSLVIVDYSTTWCGPCKGMLDLEEFKVGSCRIYLTLAFFLCYFVL